MALIRLTNKTASLLPLNSSFGVLRENESRAVEASVEEIERYREDLLSLRDKGLITFEVEEPSPGPLSPLVSSVLILSGRGTPNDVVSAPVGSLYMNIDGGAGTTLYVKEEGNTSSLGWVPK